MYEQAREASNYRYHAEYLITDDDKQISVMRAENEGIINIIECVSRIKFPTPRTTFYAADGRGGGGGGGEEEETCLMRRTEDVIQRDTEAESNIPRRCNSTMYEVMNERSPRIILWVL